MDPDNELYDAASELVTAAERLLRASRRDGVDAAVAATLGCLSTSVGMLQTAGRRLGRRLDDDSVAPLAEAVAALGDAAAACEEARARAAHVTRTG
jgi:hypothetical protein